MFAGTEHRGARSAPRKPHIFLNPGNRPVFESIAVVQLLERHGFPGVFSSGTPGDNITLSMALLDRTSRIMVGTGIAGIYQRHAHTMVSGAALIEELHPGRFVLGLGVTHVPLLEEMGVRHGKPLADMRRYVRAVQDASAGVPRPPIVIGALRRRMTALAGEIADGVMWANAALSHLPTTMAALPSDRPESFILSTSAPVCVSPDPSTALDGIRRYLLFYMQLEHYQNYFIEAGYEPEVLAARAAIEAGDEAGTLATVSERLARDVGIFGTPDEVRRRAADWYRAGITHLVLDPVPIVDGDNLQAIQDVVRVF